MQELEIILSVAGTAVCLLVTTVTFIMKFVKSTKAKKVCEQVIEIGNAVIPHYSGEEKKAFVMTKANQYAIDNGIEFDQQMVSDKIEELVNLTKEVNKREKDIIVTPVAPPASN